MLSSLIIGNSEDTENDKNKQQQRASTLSRHNSSKNDDDDDDDSQPAVRNDLVEGNRKMEEQQQQQQQQQPLHRGVVGGIASLADPRWREQRHKLFIDGDSKPVDRRSLQHLVDFLDGRRDSHHEDIIAITELYLNGVGLLWPSDGGLNVLRTFFARSDTTLTKVTLGCFIFGEPEEASQLLAAFHTSRTVVDLTIDHTRPMYLEGATLGTCISSLLQNMPQLKRLDCSNLRAEGFRAMLPGLRLNRTLKELVLCYCRLDGECLHLLADALVGNSIIQVLNISYNAITSVDLADIMRLIESTKLNSICFSPTLLRDEAATRGFVTALQVRNTSLQELPMIRPQDFPGDQAIQIATFSSINNSLTRNRQLNLANTLLLAPPPPPQQQQQQRNVAASMMLKISHKAIAKFAMVPNNSGASAIFKLFQARPALLEKRLKRPAAVSASVAVTVSRQHHQDLLRNDDDDVDDDDGAAEECGNCSGRKKKPRRVL
jgi:hypothetical protein